MQHLDMTFREKIKTFGYWRNRVVEVVLSVMVVFIITTYLEHQEEQSKDLVPASDWFEVSEIWVPDHEQGTNPDMVYERAIKRAFRAFWIVEVQRRGDVAIQAREFSNECTGAGTNDYEPDEIIPGNVVSWQWFLGRECSVPPGDYRLVATWDMNVPGWPVKRYKASSNVFRIYGPGDMPLSAQTPR